LQAVPLGCLYSPLKQIQGLAQVQYNPITCKSPQCNGILNPYCRVDFMNKLWVCPFCLTRNHFPAHYSDISSENRPAEIIPQFTTIEYVLDSHLYATNPPKPPVFLFVIDTCVIEEELKQVKTSILQSLMLLPEHSLVGLITFGRNVSMHELSFEECPKSYVFRGDKELTTQQIIAGLGLKLPQQQGHQNVKPSPTQYNSQQAQLSNNPLQSGINRFLMPVSEAEYQLTQILEGLGKDSWQYKNTERPQRCTGAAMSAAVGLLESTVQNQSARIMMFIGGPPTVGPGQVVSQDMKESIRSHLDLHKGNAPFFKKATKFYETIAQRAVQNGHCLDLFACSLDQVGLAEMRVCAEKTGGFLVLDDSFTRGVFIGSFKRAFLRDGTEANDLTMCFGGELTVLTSREFKVSGAIGNVTSLDKKGTSIGETEVGIGGTVSWALGGLDNNSTVGLYFEIVNQNPAQNSSSNPQEIKQSYLQIVTKFKHASGRTHLRVSTISKTFAELKSEQGIAYLRAGFDQEAAAVLISRLAVHKTANEFTFDILRWVDRTLIRLVSKFASYRKDDANSFKLSTEFSYYPQFMFHLRRSQFLQVFNSSPDETAFFRSILLRENTTNSLIMIQPTLMSYSLDGPAEPVILDVSSAAPNRILVLDTFFHLVIWYGDTIAKWQADGIHLKPEYDYFAQLLKAPKQDATALMESRFPYPRFIECVQNGSQSRYIMAKLNPSITQATTEYQQSGAEPPVFTEDVSMKVFMQHLKRLAVQE
jgi:protein transport protein SEC23